MKKKGSGFIAMLIFLYFPFLVKAQLSAEEAARANNPLANTKALNLQNYYVPSIYEDASLKANSMLIRYAMPFADGKILLRVTLPFTTAPSGYIANGQVKSASGLGDLNFFATYTFSKPGAKTLLGVGPQVVIPTGSNDFTGSGKWQLGGAFIMFNASSPVFQWGSLVIYQTSIAGQSDRPDASLLVLQPFLLFQLGKGAYLRSTALWNFNIESGYYNVPFGFGAGHALKVDKLVFNIFLEPQFTFLHYGTGQPAVQLFAGINCQF